MNQILVIGEDAMSCALGERMVAATLPGWSLAKETINTNGITKLVKALPRYVQQAQHVRAVLCVADTDGRCAIELLKKWMPANPPERFMLRLAVSEAESWLLSDDIGVAEFLDISAAKVPRNPDLLPDAKREVLRLARLSKRRLIRQEVVSALDVDKPGVGYNTHLCKFVSEKWEPARARTRSASLDRSMCRLFELGNKHG